jgi:pilus assembly protein Flp/PilA
MRSQPALRLDGRPKDDHMSKCLEKLIRDERGATAVEYALILAAIAAVIVGVVFALGAKLKSPFESVSNGLP